MNVLLKAMEFGWDVMIRPKESPFATIDKIKRKKVEKKRKRNEINNKKVFHA